MAPYKENAPGKAAEAQKGSKFPGIPDADLVQVSVGSVKEGSTKIKPTTFTIPGKKH